jgi:putative spermidine/putrescine transport system substrate-binding protein
MTSFSGKSLLAGVAGLALVALAGSASAEPAKELHILWAGGQWGDAVDECVHKPLMEQYGIKAVAESPGGLAKMQAMVEAGNITSTVFDMPTDELERAKALGLLQKIDWDKIDPYPIFEEAKGEYGAGTSYYSTIMAWRDGVKAPTNWIDFFDTENFPGKRALPDYPGFVLPFAAMGDGVPASELFPLDLDRAFKTLDRIKDDTIWWQAGAQPPQLLQDNEAQYAISWSGRVVGKENVKTSFKDGMLDISWFVIPKGADPAEVEAAWIWLKLQTDAKVQACIAQYISYTGPSPDLDPLLPQDKLDEYPTTAKNKSMQWLADGKWWYDHADEIEKRWQEFKLAQ